MPLLTVNDFEQLLLDHNPTITWDILALSVRIKRLVINGRLIRNLQPKAFEHPLHEVFAEVPEDTHIVLPREGCALTLLSFEFMMADQYQVLLWSSEWPELREGDLIEVINPRTVHRCPWCFAEKPMSSTDPGYHEFVDDGIHMEVVCHRY